MTLSEVEVKDLIKSVSLAVEDEDKLMTKLNNILQDKLAEKEEKNIIINLKEFTTL